MKNLPPKKNRRVLVIDDNRAIHDDFRKILSPATPTEAALDVTEEAVFGRAIPQGGTVAQAAFEVDSAYQGQEGVQMASNSLAAGHPYAMAFVDVRMPPGWDGVETTRKLWELDPDLQVVLCTAYSDYSWGEMFEKLGQSDGLLILKKPFDAVEAFQLAHALTEKWELHQQSRRKMEELERMVAERTQELASSLSLLNSTFESTADGIVVVDRSGNVVSHNAKFAAIWHLPAEMLARGNAAEMRDYAAGQVKDSAVFLQRVKELNADPEAEGFDEIELKDGRTFERYVIPQRMDGRCVGSVINWRDITERKLAEESLRESEERFSGAFEHAPIGVALVSPDGHWLQVNRACCDLVGYSEADLLTRTFQDITHPDDLAGDLEHVRQLLAGEIRSYQMEKRYIHKSGRFVAVLLNVSLVRDGRGQPRYFISQIQDITERKQAENALRVSNEKFNQLADNITDAFWIRSPDLSEVHYVSPAFEQIWGRSIKHLYANPHEWVDYILPEDRQRVMAAFAELTGDTPRLDIEYRIVRPDGEIRWVRVRGFQVRDASDKLIRHIGIVSDVTEGRRAAESLRLLGSAVEQSKESILITDAELNPPGPGIIFVNPAFTEMTGYTAEDVIGKTPRILHGPRTDRAVLDRLRKNLEMGEMFSGEAINYRKDGTEFDMEWQIAPLRNAAGIITHFVAIQRDITERKLLEGRLFQSQKLETVGKLAGGIAHEFNSILTAIIGQSELLLADLPPGSPLLMNASEISKAAGRAAVLTRQLLAYGRKQLLKPEILDLNSVLSDMESTLCHLMGREVDVRLAPAKDLASVKVDAGQIEQVIMNIVLNARDAMPNGGKLTLETGNVSFDSESVSRYPELKPGDYVMLAITDTGTGMSEEVKARAFEPFYSTKGVGVGTGLGLSTCYGIIKQSSGHISLYSEPARGSSFKIYLPQVRTQTKPAVPIPLAPDLPTGTEIILLVEDDPALREMAATLLRRLGYMVLPAANGIEALSLHHQREAGHIDLLFTDVIMPHMSGKELADRVKALYPRTRILFTSAYTENAVVHQGALDPGVALLQKPYTPSALARKVREMLDQPGTSTVDAAQKTFGFTRNPDEAKTTGTLS